MLPPSVPSDKDEFRELRTQFLDRWSERHSTTCKRGRTRFPPPEECVCVPRSPPQSRGEMARAAPSFPATPRHAG
jgi:hypothetical protein